MSHSRHRFAALSVIAVACLTLAGCTKFSARPVSQEELASFYKVPVKEQPLYKYEWNFLTAHYVRLVLERQERPEAPWVQVSEHPIATPCRQATVLFSLSETRPFPRKTTYYRELHFRLKWSDGWFVRLSSAMETHVGLELPSGEFRQTVQEDAERLLLLSSGGLAYRLRLESRREPFSTAKPLRP